MWRTELKMQTVRNCMPATATMASGRWLVGGDRTIEIEYIGNVWPIRLFFFYSNFFIFLHFRLPPSTISRSQQLQAFSFVIFFFYVCVSLFNYTNLILVHITIMNLGECILHNAIPLSMGVFIADTRCHSGRVYREETLSASVLRGNRVLSLAHHRLRRDPCTRHAHRYSMPSTELQTKRACVSVWR